MTYQGYQIESHPAERQLLCQVGRDKYTIRENGELVDYAKDLEQAKRIIDTYMLELFTKEAV